MSTILGLVGAIFGIIAIISHYEEYFSIVGIIGISLIIIAILSSFYVNTNSKIGSILLITIGILIVFYFAEFFNPYQMTHYNNLTYTRVPVESAIKHNLGVLSGIILFIAGTIELIKLNIFSKN